MESIDSSEVPLSRPRLFAHSNTIHLSRQSSAKADAGTVLSPLCKRGVRGDFSGISAGTELKIPLNPPFPKGEEDGGHCPVSVGASYQTFGIQP
jgi:hypothetical protein